MYFPYKTVLHRETSISVLGMHLVYFSLLCNQQIMCLQIKKVITKGTFGDFAYLNSVHVTYLQFCLLSSIVSFCFLHNPWPHIDPYLFFHSHSNKGYK